MLGGVWYWQSTSANSAAMKKNQGVNQRSVLNAMQRIILKKLIKIVLKEFDLIMNGKKAL